MPHAIERLLATPKIRPRLPRIKSEVAGMTLPVQAGRDRPYPYGIGPKAHQARRLSCSFGTVNSIHLREYVQQTGVCVAIEHAKRHSFAILAREPIRPSTSGRPAKKGNPVGDVPAKR